MRCFLVLMHGSFEPNVHLHEWEAEARGFYTTRWVVASGEEAAFEKACHSIIDELQQWSDIRDGLISVEMEPERIDSGSWWRWLRGGGRGFSFYGSE